MNGKSYRVTVSHPTGFHHGTHTIRVVENTDGTTRYCTGGAFGCSRDYDTSSDNEAIRRFLAEHACSVTKTTKIKN